MAAYNNDPRVSCGDLTDYARDWFRETYGEEFDGTIELKNRRWKTTFARIRLFHDKRPPTITFCTAKNAERPGRDAVIKTLKHELVHWWLFKNDKPFDDTDRCFIEECARVGATVSNRKDVLAVAAKYNIEVEVSQ